MATVRRCLGCSATYAADEPACPKCGSYAAEVETEKTEAKPKRRDTSSRRKT
jgi:rRNA maturation endonuclease Nob1